MVAGPNRAALALRAPRPRRGASAIGDVAVRRRASAMGRPPAHWHAHRARPRLARSAWAFGDHVDVSAGTVARAPLGAGAPRSPSRLAERGATEPFGQSPARGWSPTGAFAQDATVPGAGGPAAGRKACGYFGNGRQADVRQAAQRTDAPSWRHDGHVQGDFNGASSRSGPATGDGGPGRTRLRPRDFGQRPEWTRGPAVRRRRARRSGAHGGGAVADPATHRRVARQGDVGRAPARLGHASPGPAPCRGACGARRSAGGGAWSAAVSVGPAPVGPGPAQRGYRARAMGSLGASDSVPRPRDEP